MKMSLYKWSESIIIIFFILLSLRGCKKSQQPIIIETGDVVSFTSTSITLTGILIDLGDGISTYGHMVSTDKSFSVNVIQSSLSLPKDTGTYTSTIDGLTKDTQYYLRAYATGSNGTFYGLTISYTLLEAGTFIDSRDNHEYNWVKIKNQVWMAENLAYLPSVSLSSPGSYTTSYYYVYNYEGTSVDSAKATTNYLKYGVLYNWPAAMNGDAGSAGNPSGVQGICPTGWHLPSYGEWIELVYNLGEERLAGGKMAESGFNARLTGSRGMGGGFTIKTGWWSATEEPSHDFTTAYITRLYKSGYTGQMEYHIDNIDYVKEWGWNLRCVKDD